MPEFDGRRLAATMVVLFVAALLLLLFARISEILVLLFMAALLSVYLSAATDAVVRRFHIPRSLALTLAIVATLGAVVGIAALIVPPVVGQMQDLLGTVPTYAQNLEGVLSRLAERYPVLRGTTLGAEGGGVIERMIVDATDFVRASLLPYLTTGGKVAVELVSVVAMAVYLARNPSESRDGLISLTPPRFRHIARTVVADLAVTLRTWIWAQMFAMLVLGVLTGIGLWLLGVPYALAFGVFAGIVAIVPFFGTIVSTLLPALLMLTVGGWVHAIAVLGLGVAVHLVEANVVAPLIFEDRVSLPPVLTLLSVLVMASLLGVLGLIVAVPTLALVMVLLRHILFGEVYGEADIRRPPSAVLVNVTGERKAVVVPQE